MFLYNIPLYIYIYIDKLFHIKITVFMLDILPFIQKCMSYIIYTTFYKQLYCLFLSVFAQKGLPGGDHRDVVNALLDQKRFLYFVGFLFRS